MKRKLKKRKKIHSVDTSILARDYSFRLHDVERDGKGSWSIRPSFITHKAGDSWKSASRLYSDFFFIFYLSPLCRSLGPLFDLTFDSLFILPALHLLFHLANVVLIHGSECVYSVLCIFRVGNSH